MIPKKLLYFFFVYKNDGMQQKDSKVTVEFYSKEDERGYNRFILNHPDSTIYHTLEWKQVLEKNYKYTTFYLLARDIEDKICAVLPLFFVKNLYGRMLDSIPQSAYGGAVGDKEYIKPLINKAIELKRELRCNCLVMRPDPFNYEDIFEDFDMGKYENWYHQIVKIEDPKFIWETMSKTNRTNIRKAIKDDVYIEEATRENELKEFHHLLQITQKRLGFSMISFEFFMDLWKIMYPKGYTKVFIARHDEKAIASTWNFPFNKRVFSMYGGWDETEKSFKANNFLDWYLILWCYKNGFECFDLGLTVKGNKGLFLYKSSFNTVNLPYIRYCLPKNSRYSNNQKFVAKIGREILRKMPLAVNNKFGMLFKKNFQ